MDTSDGVAFEVLESSHGGGDEEEWYSPIDRLAELKHEFGEHGGVNMSVEKSSTFTFLHAQTMPEIFQGREPSAAALFVCVCVVCVLRF
jgi:hypothetical protein